MPVKRSRSRSRKPRRAPMRKRSQRKRVSRKKNFKWQALKELNSEPANKIRYETMWQTTTAETLGTKQLLDKDMTLVAWGANNDGRLNDRIRMAGIRIRLHMRNLRLSPLVVNIALVIPKVVNFDFKDRFFRGLGLNSITETLRGVDFDTVTSLSGIHYATLPINTDEFGVIWHTRFKLGAPSTSEGFSSGELKNYRSLYRYVKINRDINYFDQGNNSGTEKIWLVMWTAAMFETVGEGVADALSIQAHVVAAYDNKTP